MIKENYNEIVQQCKSTAEPVFLTNNGEKDLVVMDIKTYNEREQMLDLNEKLQQIENDRLKGEVGYSAKDVIYMMRKIINEAANSESK